MRCLYLSVLPALLTPLASCILIALFCTTHVGFAKTATGGVRVLLRHHLTAQAIDKLSIVLDDGKQTATSDSSGTAQFADVPRGRHHITISGKSYKTVEHSFTLSDDLLTLMIPIRPDAVAFPEVAIESDRRYSYQAASSAALRTIDIDLRPKNSAQDLLRLVPGLVIAQHAGGGKYSPAALK